VAYNLVNAPAALVRAYQAAYVPTTNLEATCPDREYEKLTNIQSIPVTNGEFTMYSTPDSAFFVTRRLIQAAQRSILIGIYDFTARHMRDLLLEAVARGVGVALMLDCNFSNSDNSAERSIFNELAENGVRCVRAPSCQGGTRRFFRVAHEKVIVIDDEWTLVQSGNYSNSSIPANQTDGVNTANFRTGNRDMGIAIKSTAVAEFFSELIHRDMQLELGGVETISPSSLVATALPPLFERAVEAVPFDLFPSDTFIEPRTVHVRPVLTPDNYLDVVPDFIASATRSIIIQQQYIRNITLPGNGSIRRLVNAITRAREANHGLQVRIIVAAPYNATSTDDRRQLRRELDALAGVGLVEGQNVRLLNKDHLTHCHNKLVIVDEEKVLISSQNWSEPAVTINREAGVIVEHPRIAGYFARIFDEDWSNAFQSLEAAPDTEMFVLENPTPENIEGVLRSGEFRLIEWGDHADV
jgi:phosphatidylserine/phosphatidylglycerophosphate/cardiolipin synthase-like enzyme